jgi:hypothetical protein
MITDILHVLTDKEKKELAIQLKDQRTQPFQLIQFALQGKTDKDWVIKKMAISESSYFKNVTLARDVLYALIKSTKANQYDEIILIRRLYLRGLEQRALEVYHKLEKEYEAEQLWGPLDILHHEAVRIYYTKCNFKKLKAVNEKAARNIDRYAVYAKLDKQLLLEMTLLEKSEMSPRESALFETRIATLLKQARGLGHHVLIFNALRCSLELYSRFNISIKKAELVVAEMDKLANGPSAKMNAYTRMILFLNAVSFNTTFAVKTLPEKYLKDLFPLSGAYSQIDMQIIFNYLYYYFVTGNSAKFEIYYKQLLAYHAEVDMEYLKHTANCLRNYLQDDFAAFARCRNEFYNSYNNRAYLEYDLMIRYLELLVMLKERDLSVWEDRIEALGKFVRRNFTASRFEVEKVLIKALKNKSAGRPVKVTANLYRFHQWIETQLQQK